MRGAATARSRPVPWNVKERSETEPVSDIRAVAPPGAAGSMRSPSESKDPDAPVVETGSVKVGPGRSSAAKNATTRKRMPNRREKKAQSPMTCGRVCTPNRCAIRGTIDSRYAMT